MLNFRIATSRSGPVLLVSRDFPQLEFGYQRNMIRRHPFVRPFFWKIRIVGKKKSEKCNTRERLMMIAHSFYPWIVLVRRKYYFDISWTLFSSVEQKVQILSNNNEKLIVVFFVEQKIILLNRNLQIFSTQKE